MVGAIAYLRGMPIASTFCRIISRIGKSRTFDAQSRIQGQTISEERTKAGNFFRVIPVFLIS
jgi:hypothetical protein